MKSATRYAFRLSSKACSTSRDLRRLKARIDAAPSNARNLYRSRSEDDRLLGSAESRRRIEADFSCAQVDLLRSSRSSDQTRGVCLAA